MPLTSEVLAALWTFLPAWEPPDLLVSEVVVGEVVDGEVVDGEVVVGEVVDGEVVDGEVVVGEVVDGVVVGPVVDGAVVDGEVVDGAVLVGASDLRGPAASVASAIAGDASRTIATEITSTGSRIDPTADAGRPTT
jgi:hypothetical protein